MQPFCAKLKFCATGAHQAGAILRALSLESQKMERSASFASAKGENIGVLITAKDIVALKASFNAHCRIIEAISAMETDALKEKEE
ncbi:hypothetical protein J4441_03605 [Candidatus Micrarchaeota archaeon]|nr:hypothetical protein [Candidatus Micrarchaeota archaeon]